MPSTPSPAEIALPGDAPSGPRKPCVMTAERADDIRSRLLSFEQTTAELRRELIAVQTERDAAQNGERKALERSRSAFRQLSEAEAWLKAVADDYDYLCAKCLGTGKDTSILYRGEHEDLDPRDCTSEQLELCDPCREPTCFQGHEMPVPRPGGAR